MASTSRIKNSFQPGKVPTLQDIGPGDIGVNNYDGKLYIRKKSGDQVSIVTVGNEEYITPDNVALTGESTAPTAALETDNDQIATTKFVKDVVLDYGPSKTGVGASGTWEISITGNAGSASMLAANPRINGVLFDGSTDITLPTQSNADLTAGSFLLSSGTYDGTTPRTFSVDASSENNSNKVVARDELGNFSASTITADLMGTASENLPLLGGTLTGVLQLVAGTAAAPAVAVGETGTGLFRPAVGVLAVATGGTEALRVDASGRVGFGYTSALGGTEGTYRFNGAIQGSATSYGLNLTSTVGTTATGTVAAYRSNPSTIEGISGLGNLRHYQATQGTITAGGRGAVVNQIGFFANGLNDATNNYGFYADSDTATGHWNFYAAGTAPNYFAGDVRVGGTLFRRVVTATDNGNATATPDSLRTGLRLATPTANITLQLPQASDLDLTFQELIANQGFEWSLINSAASTFTVTITGNTQHTTLVGNMVVAASTSGRFLTRKLGTTYATYRLA